MQKFSARGMALITGVGELCHRLLMCTLPTVLFGPHLVVMAAAMAVMLGIGDGYCRLWGVFTARSFAAQPEGLRVQSGSSVKLISWSDVLAIQAWHRFNHLDYVAVHHFCAGQIEVVNCMSQYAEQELRGFVCACARYVSSDAPRTSIRFAGLSDRSVHRRLLTRMVQDVAATTVVGTVLGSFGLSIFLGLLAASVSACVAASRYSTHSMNLVQKDGIWWIDGPEMRPLPAIPRGLRLWVRCLSEVTPSTHVIDLEH